MRASLTGRSWGDGHTTRSRHTIADIQYTDKSSAIRCSDGELLQADTPEALEALWQGHGGALMDLRGAERGTPPDREAETARARAAAAIVALGRSCTCATMPIEQCPNYVPSLDDEEEENE